MAIKYKFEEDGHVFQFETDEEYYAYKRMRSQFSSMEEYEKFMEIRARFNSDEEFLMWLNRYRDEAYQRWMTKNNLNQSDSEHQYQEYISRRDDNLFQSWLGLKSYHSLDYVFSEAEYQTYLTELKAFGSKEGLQNHINSELEKRWIAQEADIAGRRQRIKKIIETLFGLLAALAVYFTIKWHWSIISLIIIIAILVIGCKFVVKRVTDNII